MMHSGFEAGIIEGAFTHPGELLSLAAAYMGRRN